MTTKVEWRAWAREARAALPDVSEGVTRHLRLWLRARGARVVLAYRALPGEVRVDGLADEFTLLTTRSRWRPEPRLTVHAWESAAEVSRAGILEPPPDAPEVPPGEADVVLVPGLAFDVTGTRLGFGVGFYDRFLPSTRGALVGVCAASLVVPELPGEPHDVRVEFIATQGGVRPVEGAVR